MPSLDAASSENLGVNPGAKRFRPGYGSTAMIRFRRAVVLLVLSATALMAIPSIGVGAPAYSWHQCPSSTYHRPVIYMKVHRISCSYGGYVAEHGFKRRWVTRVGHFRCTRVRNALNVVWVYTCYRHNRRQGLFFDTPKRSRR